MEHMFFFGTLCNTKPAKNRALQSQNPPKKARGKPMGFSICNRGWPCLCRCGFVCAQTNARTRQGRRPAQSRARKAASNSMCCKTRFAQPLRRKTARRAYPPAKGLANAGGRFCCMLQPVGTAEPEGFGRAYGYRWRRFGGWRRAYRAPLAPAVLPRQIWPPKSKTQNPSCNFEADGVDSL